jgi:hypothetical protein
VPERGTPRLNPRALTDQSQSQLLPVSPPSAAAMLAGAVVGGPAAGVVTAGAAGAVGVLKAGADVEAAKLRAQGKPFYFLWQARQSR